VEVYSFAAYATWQATEKLSLNLRGEYAHGDANAAYYYESYYNYPYGQYIGHEKERYSADVFSLTATLQYNLWANVISRLELRYDTVCATSHEAGIDGEYGYFSDSYNYPNIDQLSLYLNIIYKF